MIDLFLLDIKILEPQHDSYIQNDFDAMKPNSKQLTQPQSASKRQKNSQTSTPTAFPARRIS